MSTGAVLAAKRGELGLTLRQSAVATRISIRHLEALEQDDVDGFAAPIYARGYLRTYARFLGLDPDPLIAATNTPGTRVELALKLENRFRRPRAVLTGRAVLAAVVVFLAASVTGYAWRQVVADLRPGAPLPAASALKTSTSSPVASPAVQARPIVIGVHVTDAVWINATIDGQQQFGDAGTTLVAGSTIYFIGVDVKITSGKAAATLISLDGRDLGPLGIGVASRDFSSQTSP